MATAPELLDAAPEVLIRPMRAADVAEVVAIERASYQFPWSEGIFRDCLRVGYICRVVTRGPAGDRLRRHERRARARRTS